MPISTKQNRLGGKPAPLTGRTAVNMRQPGLYMDFGLVLLTTHRNYSKFRAHLTWCLPIIEVAGHSACLLIKLFDITDNSHIIFRMRHFGIHASREFAHAIISSGQRRRRLKGSTKMICKNSTEIV